LPGFVPEDLADRILSQPNDPSKAPVSRKDEFKYIYSSIYSPYAIKEYYPSVIRTTAEVDEFARLWPQLQNLMMQKEVEWMTGKSDIDKEYDTFLKDLEKYQIKRVLELYQTPLDRYNKK
jgi:putative aldouronate transport system substrate-binding protein